MVEVFFYFIFFSLLCFAHSCPIYTHKRKNYPLLALQRSKNTLQRSKKIFFPCVKLSLTTSIPCVIRGTAAVFPRHTDPFTCLLVTTANPLTKLFCFRLISHYYIIHLLQKTRQVQWDFIAADS